MPYEPDDELYVPFSSSLPDPLDAQGEEDPEPDDLSDLFGDDPDAKARFEAALAKAENRGKTAIGGKVGKVVRELRQAGFDLTDAGLDVRNPQALTRFLSRVMPELAQQAPAAKEEPEEKLPELPAEIPSQFDDPEGFKKFIETVAQLAAAAPTKELKRAQSRIDQLEGKVGDATFSDVLAVAEEVLPRYEGMEELLEHKDFAKVLRATFHELQIPREAWGDPKTLARVAAIARVDLQDQGAKDNLSRYLGEPEDPEDGPRNRRERRDREAAETDPRRIVSDLGRRQIGSSGGRERPSGRGGADEGIQRLSKLSGLSVAEVQALKQPSPDAYNQIRAKNARKK